MKKVLFIAAALAIGTTGFAQKGMERIKAVKPQTATADIHKRAYGRAVDASILNFAPSASIPTNSKGADYEGWATMLTRYDLQGNGFVANRMWRFDDGSLGVTATWSQLANMSDRGTGYNYYDGTAFQWDQFDGTPLPGRVENEKTGWPSYCQYGPDGEIIVAHTSNDLVYYTREKKGEGAWQGPNHIPNPSLGLPTEILTWPRVVTSGPNHDIIHVLCADQDDATYVSYDFYARSTNGEDWVVSTVPTLPDAHFSSDYYALASNGNTVAMLFVGDVSDNAYLIKSTDNGETWEQTIIWDNPYSDFDWETDPNSLWGCEDCEEYLYGPETGALTIDDNGMVHCAFSQHSYYHDELGTSYHYIISPHNDGIFYWNESMGTMVAPEWTCPEDGTVIPSNPMNCCRMWWPTGDGTGYIVRNMESNNNLVGFITPTEAYNEMNNDQIFYSDYSSFFQGNSALPAIAIDDNGTIAIAFSCLDLERDMYNTNQYYFRSVYVSFLEPGYVIGDATGDWSDIPGNVYYNYVKLQDADDFMHSMDECIGVSAAPNVTNGEFWFSYQADDTPGLFIPTEHSQNVATDNIIWVQKVVADYEDASVGEQPAVNPMTNTRIYPNPVVDQMTIEVNASQASEMSISVYNLMGQKVMDKNVSINTGINTPTLNTSSLSSGVYFVTVKANGFENTMKFVVK